jgi:hypothetical protein
MSLQKVTAKLKDGDPITVQYDYGDNLDEAKSKFGEEAVYNRYRASMVIDLQGYIRSMLRKDPPATEDEIHAAVAEWDPKTRSTVRRSPAERIHELMARLTEDEKADILAQIAEE